MYNKYFPMKYPVSTLISNISTTRYSIKATQAGTIYLVVVHAETLEETIESGPLCITGLFQNKISL